MADQPRDQPRVAVIKNATNLTLTFVGRTHTTADSQETIAPIDLPPGAILNLCPPDLEMEMLRVGWTEIVIKF